MTGWSPTILDKLIERIDLTHFQYPVSLTTREPVDFSEQMLVVTSHVRDRDTGMPSDTTFTKMIALQWFADMPSDCRVRMVYDVVFMAVAHEVNEAFLVDGTRPFDPHSAT